MLRFFLNIVYTVVFLFCTTTIHAQNSAISLTYPTHFTALFRKTDMLSSEKDKIKWPGIHQAFFCRMETQIEKKSSVGFRFRLGSLDYVNMLENKK